MQVVAHGVPACEDDCFSTSLRKWSIFEFRSASDAGASPAASCRLAAAKSSRTFASCSVRSRRSRRNVATCPVLSAHTHGARGKRRARDDEFIHLAPDGPNVQNASLAHTAISTGMLTTENAYTFHTYLQSLHGVPLAEHASLNSRCLTWFSPLSHPKILVMQPRAQSVPKPLAACVRRQDARFYPSLHSKSRADCMISNAHRCPTQRCFACGVRAVS